MLTVTVQPHGQTVGLDAQGCPRPSAPTSSSRFSMTAPAGSRTQQPTTVRPVHERSCRRSRCGRRAWARAGRRWNARSFHPHHRRVEHLAAAPPRLDLQSRRPSSRVVGKPSRWHLRPSATSTAATSASAARTADFVAPSHQTRSVSVPGRRCQPASHQLGVPFALLRRLRDVVQPAGHRGPTWPGGAPVPAVVGRARSALTPSCVSTRERWAPSPRSSCRVTSRVAR